MVRDDRQYIEECHERPTLCHISCIFSSRVVETPKREFSPINGTTNQRDTNLKKILLLMLLQVVWCLFSLSYAV